MRFPLIRYSITIILCLSLFGCIHQEGKKEKPELVIDHVYVNGLPDPYDGWRPDVRFDFYYVHNYTDADLPLFIKMVDTLSFDTSYMYHTHSFLKYDDELPDKVELNDTDLPQGDRLVYEDFHEYTILDFTFSKNAFIPGNELYPERIKPNHYTMSIFEEGERKRHYFLKDSISGKLKEVDREFLFPESNYKPG